MFNYFLQVMIFLGGAALLIFSVEKFVGNLVRTSYTYGISAFILAVIFAGMDFENWGFGISAVLKGVPDIALGSAIGSAMFLMGAAIVIGGFITPFDSKTPRDYLLLMIMSPVMLLLFLLDGMLTRIDGVIILFIFALILLYLVRRERTSKRARLRDEEVEEAAEELGKTSEKKWIYPTLMIIFLIGIVIGAELSVRGAKELVQNLGLSGTIFGMTIVGLVMSLEEVLLVVEPVRKGEVSVATGNIVGSLIFFSLGNIGLLAAIRGFSISESVLTFYWPVMFATILLVGVFLVRGKIGRAEAIILAGIYLAYWVISYGFL
ncbi:cation:proton antiporter [candidate division MSBL1 archaeon SCGC-AAA261O19]|uniref:Cation:proton antiporter n=1 Tax=candidate division MSBL1 archaeon SCGC-AAA261O19 TaxID=1698277 RepID=A0A133VDB8_9EURY|nr:cation:proton antiporter [candidate division MSBL1 archaeon SCGC-AAA261O19]